MQSIEEKRAYDKLKKAAEGKARTKPKKGEKPSAENQKYSKMRGEALASIWRIEERNAKKEGREAGLSDSVNSYKKTRKIDKQAREKVSRDKGRKTKSKKQSNEQNMLKNILKFIGITVLLLLSISLITDISNGIQALFK